MTTTYLSLTDPGEMLAAVFDAQREAEGHLDHACHAAGQGVAYAAPGATAGAESRAYRAASASLRRAAGLLDRLADPAEPNAVTAAVSATHDITPDWAGYSGPAVNLTWQHSAGMARAADTGATWVLVPTDLLSQLAEDAAPDAVSGAADDARDLLRRSARAVWPA